MGLFNRLFSSSDENGDVTGQSEETLNGGDAIQDETTDSSPDITPVVPILTTPVSGDGATRQLPAERLISVSNSHLIFGQTSDVGMVRTNNQDSALSFFSTSRSADELPDFGIFIVADGMGGHHDGEKASAMATRIVATEVTSSVYVPILSGSDVIDMPPITEILVSAVQKANVEVHQQIPKGGGTTCTAVVVLGDRAYIAHVGDSRAYLITKDGIEQITRDHSMVQRLVELGQLPPEEALTHPRHNELYRAIGFKDVLEVDALSRRLPPNSRLLLCCDGLWNYVSSEEILNLVLNHPNPQEACNKLVALANTRGGNDNITVILLRTF